MQRAQMPGSTTDPVCQRRPVQIDALAGINLGLAIERQMVGIFGHQNLGDRGLGRQAALCSMAHDFCPGFHGDNG